MKIDARYCTSQIRGRQLLEADSDIGSEDLKDGDLEFLYSKMSVNAEAD
jgi:hypothetical protein